MSAIAMPHDTQSSAWQEQPPGFDPYTYTSGRWLKQDRLQRQARQIKFDYPALCRRAIQACPGASKIVRQEKKEGSFNRAFLLHMDNGPCVVARIPFTVAGPQRLITNSEVATIAYIRAHTTIPVPKILDWNDDPTNSTGTEYIIMEHVPGVQLQQKWGSMNSLQQMLCVKSAVTALKQMANLQFPAYGSLYFMDVSISPSLKLDLFNGFCIGPHCGALYWCVEPGESRFYNRRKPNQGPWTDLSSYCSGLIDTGFSRGPTRVPAAESLPSKSVQDHLDLLAVSERIVQDIIKHPVIQNVAAPMLMHPDFHKRNIFVSAEDPTRISAIIDWQSTSVEPVFMYVNETPDMIEDPATDKPLLEDETDASLEPTQNQTGSECVREISICEQTFEVALKGWIPKLHDARALDETLLRPIRYCHTSWRDGSAALRQELIELSQRWHELGFPGPCPYQPTSEELELHAKEWESFESLQSLKLFLIRSMNANTDGWVPSEAWEAAKDANQSVYEEWIKTAAQSEDPDMNEERARRLWPFDVNIDE
ncbi:hypothetical protein ACN47E_001497 [Coniothyrium glycines]